MLLLSSGNRNRNEYLGLGSTSGGSVGRSLLSLLGTLPFLELTDEYHCHQRFNQLMSLLKFLHIDQDMGSDEKGEEER